MKGFSLTNGTRHPVPRVPFSNFAENILGRHYELSVVLVGDTRMQRLNRSYRNKDTTTDILAFPLEKNSGEIILNVRKARAKAKKFGMTPNDYLNFVFIHGLLHLKGMDHGRTMERLEDTWCRKFGVPYPVRD